MEPRGAKHLPPLLSGTLLKHTPKGRSAWGSSQLSGCALGLFPGPSGSHQFLKPEVFVMSSELQQDIVQSLAKRERSNKRLNCMAGQSRGFHTAEKIRCAQLCIFKKKYHKGFDQKCATNQEFCSA